MSNPFFDQPILNSPYKYPSRHWELDEQGQPTQRVLEERRKAKYVTPIPKPRKQKKEQRALGFDEGLGLSSEAQQYEETASRISEVRYHVDQWRRLPESAWGVTPETARLLKHWRHHPFSHIRPFFCQVEAAETAIWLTEVAPHATLATKKLVGDIERASRNSNPDLFRIALKLATGAGKTTVMAMLIAWQTVNAVRSPGSKNFTRGFLIVAPGLTIKDRLNVLLPNDLDSYYIHREMVPADMVADLARASIVITNYHAFKLRERMDLAKGTRSLLQGRGNPLSTLETEGQMIQRVMPGLMNLKRIMVINDEAHHCYRHKPDGLEEEDLKGEDKEEAKRNNEAARLWISGLEAVNRVMGTSRVMDLSATPFFLRGSGYKEGTLFHWTACDFSLMDAIESGIVKLPRVPVSDNIAGGDVPKFRNLWDNIRSEMPKKGRGKAGNLQLAKIPTLLQTALDALYGHYDKTFRVWEEKQIAVPPCFIIVCNNTSASKLVYDYVSGFRPTYEDGSAGFQNGHLPLFRNFDDNGEPIPRPRTLLIDSEQLESGEALDDNFRSAASDEIERFRREKVARSGGQLRAEDISDSEILREVMNTVGKTGRLGESVRCVVSVSMLTEGWDANTVTHVLGVRAFGTQLLCEQVIGRALRRQSYEPNEEGLFNVEYADILGIPFDFTAKPVIAPPQPPRDTIRVEAVSPERDHLEIRFPRVGGYLFELPEERIEAAFNRDSTLELTPDLIGPSITNVEGIIGEGIKLTLDHLKDMRRSSILYHLTQQLIFKHFRDNDEQPKLYLFGQLKHIAKEWMDSHLECKGGTNEAQLLYPAIAEMACQRIVAAITRAEVEQGKRQVRAVLDPYNPSGSSRFVRFNTSRAERWKTDSRRCHVNWVIFDSDWETEFCRVAESHPRVRAYVKNHGLNFEVPYRCGREARRYLPDFIVLVEDGHGEKDLLRLVVEIKGYRREDAKDKKSTMDTYWVKGVNHLGTYGRWGFLELTEVHKIESDFSARVEAEFNKKLEQAAPVVALA
ncbi:MAG: DEAD/DEAH box helicase family protein [Acidobacteriota bacterium]|nr:DEAD/DEAH box helicase family protein [Acidobacteriota bacterium]